MLLVTGKARVLHFRLWWGGGGGQVQRGSEQDLAPDHGPCEPALVDGQKFDCKQKSSKMELGSFLSIFAVDTAAEKQNVPYYAARRYVVLHCSIAWISALA